jgi:hypothetical protein
MATKLNISISKNDLERLSKYLLDDETIQAGLKRLAFMYIEQAPWKNMKDEHRRIVIDQVIPKYEMAKHLYGDKWPLYFKFDEYTKSLLDYYDTEQQVMKAHELLMAENPQYRESYEKKGR